jgi:hypothetical protein
MSRGKLPDLGRRAVGNWRRLPEEHRVAHLGYAQDGHRQVLRCREL